MTLWRIVLGAAIGFFGCAIPATCQSWSEEQKTDALRGTHYAQFSLVGSYLTPPKEAKPGQVPMIFVQCVPKRAGKSKGSHTDGVFLDGYILVGGIVDAQATEHGDTDVVVQFRLDDGKLQTRVWKRSTDFSAVFFSEPFSSGWDQLANLLYGHELNHKENTSQPVKKVVIGLDEYLGAEVVMQFDMPDPTGVADACGILERRGP